MKKYISIILIGLFVFSCSEKKNMTVTGSINGLQKGKLYLQRFNDTLFVNVDSVELNGKSEFLLKANVLSPEIYLLKLAGTDKTVKFFGEKGNIKINTTLNTFNIKAAITGSENQKLLDKFNDNIQKFNDLGLDLFKEKLDAIIAKDQKKVNKVVEKIDNIEKRKLRFILNFTFKNASHEIAPYVTLTELNNVKISVLDTIINSLSTEVKQSKYGKQLIDFVANSKK